MMPLAIDLFCGLFGWGQGLIAEGYRVVGFDLHDMHAEIGLHRPPEFRLVLQDVLTIHGKQFANADLIVASPPCQAYSYRAMPWKRAKALPPPDNSLFEACFRIQREAIEAAGRHIPLVVENVRGAQKWVGRARWHFGSFYLWGDVPALMPITKKAIKVATMGAGWYPPDHPKHVPGLAFNTHAERLLGRRTDVGKGARFTSRDCGVEGIKNPGVKLSDAGFNVSMARQIAPALKGATYQRTEDDKRQHLGINRKAASAMIAKIPLVLSRHIGKAWYPERAA